MADGPYSFVLEALAAELEGDGYSRPGRGVGTSGRASPVPLVGPDVSEACSDCRRDRCRGLRTGSVPTFCPADVDRAARNEKKFASHFDPQHGSRVTDRRCTHRVRGLKFDGDPISKSIRSHGTTIGSP
jgi:hypothetical protein